MVKICFQRLAWVVVMGLAAFPCAGSASAQMANPFDSSVIQPAGPLTPPNGINFTDVIGQGNQFGTASYAVLDFNSSDLGLSSVSTVQSLTLHLFQTLFGASSRGKVSIFVTDDTTTPIDFGTSTLIFDTNYPNGLGGQLANLYLLGNEKFHLIRGGHADAYSFAITDAALNAYLVSQINTGGVIRIIVAPDTDLVGGSWGGYANSNMALVPVLTAVAQ